MDIVSKNAGERVTEFQENTYGEQEVSLVVVSNSISGDHDCGIRI